MEENISFYETHINVNHNTHDIEHLFMFRIQTCITFLNAKNKCGIMYHRTGNVLENTKLHYIEYLVIDNTEMAFISCLLKGKSL